MAGVAGWVRQTTGDKAQQTPLFAWGGGDAASSQLPKLIAVPGDAEPNEPKALDHGESIKRAPGNLAVEGQAAEPGTKGNELARCQRACPFDSAAGWGIWSAMRCSGRFRPRSTAAKLPGTSNFTGHDGSGRSRQAREDRRCIGQRRQEWRGSPAETGRMGVLRVRRGAAKRPNTKAGNSKAKSEANDSKSAAGEATQAVSDAASVAQVANELHRAWQLRDELVAFDAPKGTSSGFCDGFVERSGAGSDANRPPASHGFCAQARRGPFAAAHDSGCLGGVSFGKTDRRITARVTGFASFGHAARTGFHATSRVVTGPGSACCPGTWRTDSSRTNGFYRTR